MLREVPPSRVAVIRCSGFWSEANDNEHLAKLPAALRDADLAWTGEAIYSRYNPPFDAVVYAAQRNLAASGIAALRHQVHPQTEPRCAGLGLFKPALICFIIESWKPIYDKG